MRRWSSVEWYESLVELYLISAHLKDDEALDKSGKNGMIYIPHPHGGGNTMRYMKHDGALKRLKNIEGHIRGIERMVEEDAYCIDLIRQIQAVRAALNKVSTMILEEHLHSCLVTAVRGDDPQERERVLKEIREVFEIAADS